MPTRSFYTMVKQEAKGHVNLGYVTKLFIKLYRITFLYLIKLLFVLYDVFM